MWICQLALEFRMELHRQEPRVVFEFDDLDELAGGQPSGGNESCALETVEIVVVEFIAMAMTLADAVLSVGFPGE